MIIPFFIPHSGCPHLCVFCNQRNITGVHSSLEVSSIPARINEYSKTNNTNDAVQVAFYGGSFTALPLETQKSYLEAVQPFIRSGHVRSLRLSTRPDCINNEILELLAKYGVETVELGAQSMHDTVLAHSGRGHTALDTADAVTQLRQAGFRVGLQLMPGLPGDSEKTWIETVERSISLGPDFVRIYPALVIKDTPLERMYRAGRYIPLTLEEAVLLCKRALLLFGSSGIDVIRIGLQPSEELQKPETVTAGPYHPAFRQLVESSILYDGMRAVLSARNNAVDPTFLIHPDDISNAIGQKRSNIETLKKEFGLKRVGLQPDSKVPRRSVRILIS